MNHVAEAATITFRKQIIHNNLI